MIFGPAPPRPAPPHHTLLYLSAAPSAAAHMAHVRESGFKTG